MEYLQGCTVQTTTPTVLMKNAILVVYWNSFPRHCFAKPHGIREAERGKKNPTAEEVPPLAAHLTLPQALPANSTRSDKTPQRQRY